MTAGKKGNVDKLLSKDTDKKLTPEEFIMRAIKLSRDEGWAGCHTVYSGFTAAYREYFHEDPDDILAQMEEDGKIRVRESQGGQMIYPVDDYIPAGKVNDFLNKILGEK